MINVSLFRPLFHFGEIVLKWWKLRKLRKIYAMRMRRPHSSLSELSWNIVIFVKTEPWVWWDFLLNTFNDTRITLGRWPLSYINVIYFLSVTVCLVLCGLCGTLGWGFRLTGLNPAAHVSLFQKFDKHIETVSDQPVIQAPPLLWTRALMTRPLWVVVMVQTTMTGFLSSPGVLPTSSSLSTPPPGQGSPTRRKQVPSDLPGRN